MKTAPKPSQPEVVLSDGKCCQKFLNIFIRNNKPKIREKHSKTKINSKIMFTYWLSKQTTSL